jgi:hypothetical protein
MNSRSIGVYHKHRGIGLCILAICFWFNPLRSMAQAPDETKATIRVKRISAFFLGVLADVVVYVNEEKIGKVSYGATNELKFTPKRDGNNTIYMKNSFNDQVVTESLNFRAGLGGYVSVDCEMGDSSLSMTNLVVSREGSIAPKDIAVKLDAEPFEKEVASEIVETLPGSRRTVKRSRTIEYAVAITDTASLEVSIKANLGFISSEIRSEVEKALSQSFKQSETIEQSIEIDGKELLKVKLIWIEKRRKGAATMTVGDIVNRVPFEFREHLELRLIKLN